MVVGHTSNPSTWWVAEEGRSEFKVSPVYRLSSRKVRVIEKSCLKR